MRSTLLLFVSFIMLLSAAEIGVRVAPFQHARVAAVSLCFDTGLRDHVERVVPDLGARDLRASFFVVPGVTPKGAAEARRRDPQQPGSVSWEEWREVAAAGHEIGNLSWSRAFLDRVTPDRLDREIKQAARTIAKRVGSAPLTFARPHDGTSTAVAERALASHAVLRGEVVGPQRIQAIGADRLVGDAVTDGQWLSLAVQGIENGHQAISIAGWNQLLTALDARSQQCWVAPYGVVARYRAQREQLKLAQQPTADGWTVTWSGALKDQPPAITLLLDLPTSGSVRFVQGDVDLPARRVGRGGIAVTVTADGGPLHIRQ